MHTIARIFMLISALSGVAFMFVVVQGLLRIRDLWGLGWMAGISALCFPVLLGIALLIDAREARSRSQGFDQRPR